jgi:hypothetical protein
MSQSLPLETSQGYAPPTVTQYSVFLDNRVGRLLDLLQRFDEHPECLVCALSVHEAADHAVVRLITNNARAAKNILLEHRLAYAALDILVVELCNGHTLSGLCLHLLAAELNIHFAYPVLLRPNGTPTIAIAVDDITLAGQILRRKGFGLLGEFDLPRSA